jgi:hypothetical protein
MAPADASTLVRLANQVAAFNHPPDWLHMPVPRDWAAPPAYAPLGGLSLPARTQVYLGLVHLTDGLAGAHQRIALASQSLPTFGIATECGWGRRPPETIPALLELHAAVLDSPN